MFRTIVCATDGSDHGSHAVRVAADGNGAGGDAADAGGEADEPAERHPHD